MTERLAYSPAEVAAALGLHVQTVRKLIDDERLGAVRVGRRLVIPASAIERFLEHENRPAPATGHLRSVDGGA